MESMELSDQPLRKPLKSKIVNSFFLTQPYVILNGILIEIKN